VTTMPKTSGMKSSIALPLSTGLDQPTPIPSLPMVLDQVDRIITQAITESKPEMAFQLASSFAQMNQVSGIGLAKTLWTLRQKWKELGQDRHDFESEMFMRLGKAPDTVRRYILVWEMFSWVDSLLDQDTRERLQSQPIAALIAMAQTMKEHGILTKEAVCELSKAPDEATVRKMLREYTGRGAPSTGVQLVIQSDGTLDAWEGGEVSHLGFLRISEEDMKDPLRSRAISRILRSAGIRESWSKDE